MSPFAPAAGLIAFAAALAPLPLARGFTFTITPVTNTTPTFAGTIAVIGTVTVAPGETFFSPSLMSTDNMPFLSNYSAGFNGPGQGIDPAFLAWNGVGAYTGPIVNHLIGPGNLGYSSGMPLGLYGSNLLGPGQQASLILNYADAAGTTRSAVGAYAINVAVPAPGVAAVLGLGGLAMRRRR